MTGDKGNATESFGRSANQRVGRRTSVFASKATTWQLCEVGACLITTNLGLHLFNDTHKSETPTHTRHTEFRTKNVSAIGQSLLAGESPLSQAVRTFPLELSLAPRWLVQMTLDTLLRCAPGPWVNQLQTELIIFPPEKKKSAQGVGTFLIILSLWRKDALSSAVYQPKP